MTNVTSAGVTINEHAAALEKALRDADLPAAGLALTQLLAIDPDTDLWWQLLPIVASGPVEQRQVLEAVVAAVPGHFGALLRLNRVGLEALQDQRRHSEQQLTALSQAESELRARIEQFQAEREQAEQHLRQLRSQREQLENDCADMRARSAALREQAQRDEVRSSLAQEAERDYERILHSLQEITRVHDNVYDRYAALEVEVQARQAKSQQLDAVARETEARLEQMMRTLGDTENQLAAATGERTRLESLAVEAQKRGDELQALRSRINAAEHELADRIRRSEAEQKHCDEVTQQRRRAEKAARRARDEEQAAWNEQQRLRAETEKLAGQLHETEAQLKAAQDRLADLVGQSNQLKEELARLEMARAELSIATNRQQADMATLKAEVQRLTQIHDELLKEQAQLRKPTAVSAASTALRASVAADAQRGTEKAATSLEKKFRDSSRLTEYLRLHEELNEELAAQARASGDAFYPIWWRALAPLAERRAVQRVFEASVTAPLDEFGRGGEAVLRELMASGSRASQWAETVLNELAEQQRTLAGFGS